MEAALRYKGLRQVPLPCRQIVLSTAVISGFEVISMDVNQKVPEIAVPDENGNPVSLKQFQGKNVVLFFYPKADTPG